MTGVIATIPRSQFFDPHGIPLAGGKLYTYLAGTTTPAVTYQDQALTTQNENPIPLDSLGSCSIWLNPDKIYKFVLKSAAGVTQSGWPLDNVSGAGTPLSLAASFPTFSVLSASDGAGKIGASSGVNLQEQLDVMGYGIVNAGDVRFAGGMGTTRTAAQNKAALQAAIASLTRPGLVQIPAGYFNIDPGVDLGTYVVGIVGAGKYATQLGCTSGVTAAYMFGLSDTTLIEYASISNLGIFGGGNIVAGVRLAKCNHMRIENCIVTGTTGNALYVGGYSNDVVGNDLFTNTGSGIYLAGTLNNVNAERNRIYNNDGVGVFCACSDTDAGLSINIARNAIEQNKLAGIISFNTKGLSITDNYFERNAATGYTYLSPENITIRADIHLLGANGTIIDAVEAYSNECAVIANNQTTPIGVYSTDPNLDGFVFTSFANNLRVTNNQVFDTTKINAMVAIYGNRAKSTIVGDLIIENNSVDSISMVGTVDANTQLYATAHFIRTAALGPKNAAPQNFLEWSVITGSTGTFVRSAAGFKGAPVFEMGDGDRLWGFTVDLSQYPELRGQYVWFGCWVNTQGNLTNARLYSGGQSSSGATDYDNDAAWKFKSVCRLIGTGESTPFFAIQKVGTGAALLIAHPVVAVAGMAYSRFTVPTDVIWKRAFYPVDGTWQLGDAVQNITPTVGQPKEWKCTAAGAPGTWVSTGNL